MMPRRPPPPGACRSPPPTHPVTALPLALVAMLFVVPAVAADTAATPR
jgi:hypothetical protein